MRGFSINVVAQQRLFIGRFQRGVSGIIYESRSIAITIIQTISMQVSPEAAQAFLSASEEERKKLELLVSLRLLEVVRARKPLEYVMREISRSTQARGLTPEILDDILKH